MAAMQFLPMWPHAARAILRFGHIGWREPRKDLKFMTTQEVASSRTYMMVAGVLMVCLLTFGILHSFGVLR